MTVPTSKSLFEQAKLPDCSELEQLLCGPEPIHPIGRLQPRADDAWTMELPGLDTLHSFPEGNARPRICIASEQFAGPVRNGGIGNTYAALAFMLAEAGFDVTALYLRGDFAETHSIEYWIDDFARRGVKLVPVPDYAARERLQTGSDRWLHAPYNMMRYLIDHPMDVVHVSEWRGSSYLCLLAKRQGLAFAETLFVVKTSSPWIWNRLYGAHVVEKAEDLAKVLAERRSVEMADMVIGGSLHLLRWMASQGYAIARDRAFVQPNVAKFNTIAPFMASRDRPAGARMPIDELVFFGRLEPRKGLFIFCQAIRRLIRSGVVLPPKITFMGKVGGRMPSHPEMEVPDYIRMMTDGWPTQVHIQTGYQQLDAVKYLLGGARLAVMPSIIENSSMAVYEAAICGIPCIASDVGGNSELIHADDHAQVLCQPHPASLGEKLEEALRLGGYVPRPSFDNAINLEIWLKFHRQLGGELRGHLLQQSRLSNAGEGNANQPSTAVCIYLTGDMTELQITLASIAAQSVAALEILIAVDADHAAALAGAQQMAQDLGLAVLVVEAYDLDAGAALNLLAARAGADHLLFLWEGSKLVPDALVTLQGIIAANGADMLTYLHRVSNPLGHVGKSAELRGLVLGSVSDQFFRNDARELPLFVRRAAFAALGGFTGDYRVLGYDHEFAAKAHLAGLRCETAMIELGSILGRSPAWLRARGYDLSASNLRAMRPLLASAPMVMRDLLLYSRSATLRTGEKGKSKNNPKGSEPGAGKVYPKVVVADSSEWDGHAVGDLPSASGAVIAKRDKGASAKSAKNAKSAQPVLQTGRSLAANSASPTRHWPNLGPETAELGPDIGSDIGPDTADFEGYADLPISAQLTALVERRSAFGEGAVFGQFLGIHRGRMYGWACDVADPNRTIELDLTVEGQASRHRAKQRFAAFAAVPPEAMRHGFVLELPEPYRTSRVGAALALRVADSSLLLADGIAIPPRVALDQCGIQGECVKNDRGMIAGWACYADEPDRRVELAAYAEGAFIARFRADLAGTPDGRVGRFEFALPNGLLTENRLKIEVVVAELGVPLQWSPIVVTGRKIRLSGWKNIWSVGK